MSREAESELREKWADPEYAIESALRELGLTADATLQSVQRRLHVGAVDAMRLLALRELLSMGSQSAKGRTPR